MNSTVTAKHALRLAALPLLGAALSGCVAAAVPIVATGAIARTSTDGEPGPRAKDAAESEAIAAPRSDDSDPASAAPEMDAPSVDPAVATLSDELPAAAPVATPAPEPASEADNESEFIDIAAATPAPIARKSRSTLQSAQLSQFVRYATLQAFRFSDGDEPLSSAVLANPASLDGERVICNPGDRREPAILIDLDPGDEAFSAGSRLPTSSTISLSLRVLRAEGVTIAWISENSAATADLIRDALIEAELDQEAEDTLLLMRYPGDRKQTRRKEFAAEHCLLAIAGDERRDFDELYEYLTNPNAALALEPLFNNGWFLLGDEAERTTPAAQQPEPIAAVEQGEEESVATPPAVVAPAVEQAEAAEEPVADPVPAEPRPLGEVQGPPDIPDETPAEAAARLLGKDPRKQEPREEEPNP